MYSAAAIGAPNAVRGPQLGGKRRGAWAAHTHGLIGRVAGSRVSVVHWTVVTVTRSPK